MTPEQIAALLTPAQVRALRKWVGIVNPMSHGALNVRVDVYDRLWDAGLVVPVRADNPDGLSTITPLGLAVLAALDKGEGE